MGDTCTCWNVLNNVIVLQHNEVKASFEKSLHVVGHTFNMTLYKRLVGFVSKYTWMHIAEDFDRVKHIGFDSERCGCVLRRTHDLPYAYELATYHLGVIPLKEVHVMWIRLSFFNMSSRDSSLELSIQ